MELDTKKQIKKEIRRVQIDKAYHQKKYEYLNEQLEILNLALSDLTSD